MTINVAALPEGGAAPPALRAAQLPAVSAAGVNDVAALARQQTQGAVPAPTLIAAYAAHVPNPPKPVLRSAAAGPSSSLAAQFIAQQPELTDEELAIFAPRTPIAPFTPEEEASVESFVSPRIARNASSPETAPANATVARAETAVTEKTAQANQSNALQGRGTGLLAASLPTLLTQFTRTPTLAQARGVGAYQLAGARNAASKKPATAEPTL